MNNDRVDLSYYGDLWTDLGINVPRPADWTRLIFLPGISAAQHTTKTSPKISRSILPRAPGRISNEMAEVFASTYDITLEGEGTPTEVDGVPALEIRYRREIGQGTYAGHGLAIFKADLGSQGTGMIFAAEALQGVGQTDTAFDLLRAAPRSDRPGGCCLR